MKRRSHSGPGGTVWANLSVVALVAMAFALPACEESRSTPAVEVSEASQVSSPRIATLLPFAADQLIALGAEPVAVPLIRGVVPASWDGIPTIALDHSAGPNIEQLIAADPDIVITGSTYAQFLPTVESATGAEVVVMDVHAIDDVATHITALGELTGKSERASELVVGVREMLESPDPAGERVRVLSVFGTPHAFYAFLPDSYLGDLVAHAGGAMITDDMESHAIFQGLAPISMEVVLDRNPDHVLVVFHGSEESARAMLKGDPLWSKLSAVEQDEVTFLQDDLFAMRPGSELPRAIDEIQTILTGARESLH
ncbi:MAG: ABC transporter substrate-binding protein [Planctomycetota bacterium]